MKYQLQPLQPKFDENGITTSEGWICVHNVDPITHEYKNASYEYLLLGVGLPAHAYLDAPQNKDSEHAIVRDGNTWRYPNDHRGKIIYSTYDGSEKQVDFIGDIPSNFTFFAPTSDFDSWDGEKWVKDNEKALQNRINLAKQEQDSRLSEADNYIFELNEAIELELATDEQKELHKSWRQYRFIVKKIDVNRPDAITWPEKPKAPNFVS